MSKRTTQKRKAKRTNSRESLKTTVHHLQKVLAVNARLNSTLEIGELLTVIMNTAAKVMSAKVASLMLLDETRQELIFKIALGSKGNDLVEKFRVKLGEGIAGSVALSGKPLIVNEARKDRRFAKRFDQATGFLTKALICVPMRAKGKLIGVLEAINPIGRAKFLSGDLKLFEIFADQAALAIENARLHAETVKQEKTRQELKIAQEIQQNFLPDLNKNRFGIDIAAKNIPARQVSGDFYDVVNLDNSKTGIVIGDVSGKGVPAALYMVRAISEYRFLAPRLQTPASLLSALNNVLAKDSPRGMFVTLLYMIADLEKKTLTYTSAGHHPILKVSAASGKVESLANTGGPPVGLVEGSPYSENTVAINPQDVFITYTDGVIEARNKAGVEYSLERLAKAVNKKLPRASNYTSEILHDWEVFTQGAEQHDDTTVLAVKI